MSLNRVQEILSVALYRLGHSGNGGGEFASLLELNNKVKQFASEEERKHAAAWVQNTTGVEEWGKGWLVVNGTHIPLAWKPGVCSQEHFCYKGFHSMNVALVILPHLLWIVKSVVGQPGSIQDLKVWASGSNILKKPHLYLDEVRVQVEHAIAYLKNRFQCLTGYRDNIYRVKDCITAAETIQACIVAHTFMHKISGEQDTQISRNTNSILPLQHKECRRNVAVCTGKTSKFCCA
ncbi:uncharacterized protein UHOD_11055 [Ustilago sp. UG-2017b]|nr:uncharacterized protein UHOD_11055 [Ustilago sp. UG-2017b]